LTLVFPFDIQGYFTFEECPGMISPTIGIEIGETYTIVQEDRSNWYHPMGFAYFPDGGHVGKPELEPGRSQTGSACADDISCPSPKYMLNGVFLGVFGTEDFGLDVYEPSFKVSPEDWVRAGNYSIELTFTDANYTQDIFYFCHVSCELHRRRLNIFSIEQSAHILRLFLVLDFHINNQVHQYMSGRIKILNGGIPVSETDVPVLGYEYDVPGEFDQSCGTFGLDAYKLPNKFCPDHFVCDAEDADETTRLYSTCIDAMNCAMMDGMTTGVRASSSTALFLHQMIPHHQNAVNMAKALLKENSVVCDDLTNEDDPDCAMEVILRNIVNTQNLQIQEMIRILHAKNFPLMDNCDVEVTTVRMIEEGDNTTATTSGAIERSAASALAGLAVAMLL
jgi:Domain of unknown function (DUF305)